MLSDLNDRRHGQDQDTVTIHPRPTAQNRRGDQGGQREQPLRKEVPNASLQYVASRLGRPMTHSSFSFLRPVVRKVPRAAAQKRPFAGLYRLRALSNRLSRGYAVHRTSGREPSSGPDKRFLPHIGGQRFADSAMNRGRGMGVEATGPVLLLGKLAR